ncbi:MAG TPA: ImmA/IrrE family metallo-endopeptidase [Verrucomicrobiae bacterium]|nr:ImmA/IrrE family metallo-endopeptidase [Verrucomicrobiae bacterium]
MNTFQPDWASAPGDTIADILAERDLSPAEFAQQIGQSLELAGELLSGHAKITTETAGQLETVLGASAAFWMARESQYQEDLARQEPGAEWVRQFPVNDLVKFGWIEPVTGSADKLAACLRFFGVADVATWHAAYGDLLEMAAFRTSPAFVSHRGAVLAWLRQGEIESESIDCKPWSPGRFKEALSTIRSLTRKKDPNLFIPELRRICAACGVAAVVVRAPTGCRASGATRFLTPNKALLQLSFRHLSDDHFWFTFFHEAGHLLLHGKDLLFLESVDLATNKAEEEANEFAGHILIDPKVREAFLRLRVDGREVIKFAKFVGVSPGIVVGQLQHYGRLKQHQLNSLKRRFTWGSN